MNSTTQAFSTTSTNRCDCSQNEPCDVTFAIMKTIDIVPRLMALCSAADKPECLLKVSQLAIDLAAPNLAQMSEAIKAHQQVCVWMRLAKTLNAAPAGSFWVSFVHVACKAHALKCSVHVVCVLLSEMLACCKDILCPSHLQLVLCMPRSCT